MRRHRHLHIPVHERRAAHGGADRGVRLPPGELRDGLLRPLAARGRKSRSPVALAARRGLGQERRRAALSVPPPRSHTVKYSGVLASASPWRARIGPRHDIGESAKADAGGAPWKPRKRGSYRPWADLLHRAFSLGPLGFGRDGLSSASPASPGIWHPMFAVDVLECPKCRGRMELLATVTAKKSIDRFLSKLGEPTDVPTRSRSRGSARNVAWRTCRGAEARPTGTAQCRAATRSATSRRSHDAPSGVTS